MSVNLDNVKAIVHNNKNVVKIENSHGIIWQAPPSGEWHTLFNTSTTYTMTGQGNKYTNIVTISNADYRNIIATTGGELKIKVTFSNIQGTTGWSWTTPTGYLDEATSWSDTTQTAPTSPKETTFTGLTNTSTFSKSFIAGGRQNVNSSSYRGIVYEIARFSSTDIVYIRTYGYSNTSSSTGYQARMTIDKVEVFY